ncbi:MAG: DUF6036 family nucleotidyltransferase [Candidatus Bathyarchaeia archaeon]|jgi:hypothetical protein
MIQRRSFDKNYLQQEFDKLNAAMKHPLTLYLIGGGAMSFYGVKDATKDIDVILTNQDDLNNLKVTLEALGYTEPNPLVITGPYNEVQTSAILENLESFRWDIFLNKVCGKLTLSNEMQNRATAIYQGNHLKILMASKEDLFLFKGITSREVDLDDTGVLARSGLNWDIIGQECRSQSELSGICWEDGLYQTLRGLKEKHGITSPIEKPLRMAAQQKLMEKTLLGQIKKGNTTIDSIAKEMKMARGFVGRELIRLVNKGLITVDKSERPYRFSLNSNNLKK